MDGQMSLFPEQKIKKKVKDELKAPDPTQTYDERTKRFWHYWNNKSATEEMIETAPGELRIIIDALADYHDIASKNIENLNGYTKAVWNCRLEKIKEIQAKLEKSIGHNRDKQLEVCKKKRPTKEDDIGEDAIVMAMKKGVSGKKEKDKKTEVTK